MFFGGTVSLSFSASLSWKVEGSPNRIGLRTPRPRFLESLPFSPTESSVRFPVQGHAGANSLIGATCRMRRIHEDSASALDADHWCLELVNQMVDLNIGILSKRKFRISHGVLNILEPWLILNFLLLVTYVMNQMQTVSMPLIQLSVLLMAPKFNGD
jgi:hypothetical protein